MLGEEGPEAESTNVVFFQYDLEGRGTVYACFEHEAFLNRTENTIDGESSVQW